MNNPETNRPPKVLLLAVRFMRDCIADLDYIQPGQSPFEYSKDSDAPHDPQTRKPIYKFMDIYSFMKDRTR